MTRSLVGDAVLALALTVASVVSTAMASLVGDPERPIDLIGYALVVATALVLVVRRRWPLPTLAVAAVLTSAYLFVGYPYSLVMVAFSVAVYTVARHVPVRHALPAALTALAMLLAHVFTNSAALPGLLGVVPGSAWVAVPFAIGFAVRLRRQSLDQARNEAVRQRVDDERLRIAQEVHDVVGHGLAAIKMQADVTLHVLAKRPEQAEAALQAISRTSTEALDELRATLAVVRRTEGEATRSPTPGLHQLDELRRRITEAGVHVSVEHTGRPRELPPAVDLAGYRVVQESLTNVLRHSAVKVADVRLAYETDAVIIVICNPAGTTGDSSGGGLGIPGMRERVEALGGELSAGPGADGAFTVRAVLPTRGHR